MEEKGRALREALRGVLLAHGVWDTRCRPCGAALPTPRAWALMELLRSPELSVAELTARMGIDRANVSRLCAKMEEEGELRRLEHPGDGRARRLQLTPKGERAARAVEASSAVHFGAVTAALGGHEEDVIDALRRLEAALRGESER